MAYIDKHGVEYTNDKKTLVRCPKGFKGEYIIPKTVNEIDDFAFSGCKGLSYVFIPNSVKEIGKNAFAGCRGISSIHLPNSITRIYEGTFNNCSNLISINIPHSVVRIDGNPFVGCKKLQVLSVGVEEFNSMYGYSSSSSMNLVRVFGTQVTKIILEDSVKCLHLDSFTMLENLESIVLPNSLEGVEKSLMFPEDIFNGCVKLREIIIPKGKKKRFKEMFGMGWDYIAGGIVER